MHREGLDAAGRGRRTSTVDGPSPAIRVCAVSASGEHGYRALADHAGRRSAGDPRPAGQREHHLALAPGLPWSLGSELLAALRGEPLKPGERLVPGSPAWGSMALAAFDARAVALPRLGKRRARSRAFVAATHGRGSGRGRGGQQAGRNDQRGPGRPLHASRPASRGAPPSPSPGTSPTCSGSTTRAISTAGVGPTPRPWPAIWPRTSTRFGSGRSFTTRRSTSRTCPRSSSTPWPRRASSFAARPASGRKTATSAGSRGAMAAAR